MTVLTHPRTRTSDPVKAFASGVAPYRALLVGAGDGREGLASALAQDLADRTGHGVDVEALPAGAPLPDRDLTRLDAVVVVLEPRKGDSPAAVRDAVRALLDDLGDRLTVGSAISLVVSSTRWPLPPPTPPTR